MPTIELRNKNNYWRYRALYDILCPYEGKYLLEEHLIPHHHIPQSWHSWSIVRIHQNVG
jgi:hypothetical protein